jgi:predicted Zn-dependent protease
MLKQILAWSLICLLAFPPQAFANFTMEDERKLGKEAFDQVKRQLSLVTDPDCLSYLRNLGTMMEKQLNDQRFKFKFHMVNQDVLNAFALPDAYIFMYSGLITRMDSEGELAAVLAHEMSHVHYRHIAGRIEQQSKITGLAMAGLLAGVLLGAVAGAGALGQAAAVGATAGAAQAALAYSREDEMQADFQGYKLIVSLGYDPRDMATTFQRLWQLERTYYGSAPPPYLLSHPTSNSRMENIQNLVRRQNTTVTRTDNSEFWRIKTRLIALYKPQDSAEQYFRNLAKEPKRRDYAHYGLALIKMRQGRYKNAMEQLSRISGGTAKTAWLQRDIGICMLGLGENQKAQDYLNQALELDPGNHQTLLALGQSLTRQNRLNEAAFTLRRLLQLNEDLPQAHYDLGVALGRMGRTGEASYHLGLAFKGQKNMKMASYHLDKARRNLRDQPKLLAKVNEELEDIKKQEEEKDGGGDKESEP